MGFERQMTGSGWERTQRFAISLPRPVIGYLEPTGNLVVITSCEQAPAVGCKRE